MENINITAVKWLKTKIEEHGDPEFCTISWTDLDALINQAKQMEKEQAFQLFKAGQDSMEEGGKNFEQYYEKYNSNKLDKK